MFLKTMLFKKMDSHETHLVKLRISVNPLFVLVTQKNYLEYASVCRDTYSSWQSERGKLARFRGDLQQKAFPVHCEVDEASLVTVCWGGQQDLAGCQLVDLFVAELKVIPEN